jgi:hypothetical protein
MIVGSFARSLRRTRMGAGRHHEDSTTRPGQPRFHPFTPAPSLANAYLQPILPARPAPPLTPNR